MAAVGNDFADALREVGIQENDIPTLLQNRADSSAGLMDAKAWLTDRLPVYKEDPVDVVVLGSYARLEASGQSDFDYLVIIHALPNNLGVGRQLLAHVDDYIEKKVSAHRPGKTGLFGELTSAVELVEKIGLEQDTNQSHSRRLLFLEESRSIYNPELHRRLMESICDRYLVDYGEPKPGPPRFLLNDVIRYWFTLAVDYQAKRIRGGNADWGLRYLKLLISRKMAFAGTVCSLLLCSDERKATKEYLLGEFEKPPFDRLAQLALVPDFDKGDALRRAFEVAETFAYSLNDEDIRNELKEVTAETANSAGGNFKRLREESDNLQSALREVFFDSTTLGEKSRSYLVF